MVNPIVSMLGDTKSHILCRSLKVKLNMSETKHVEFQNQHPTLDG